MEIENFKVIQELQFQSDYAQPKDHTQQTYSASVAKGNSRMTRSALQGQRSFMAVGNRSQLEGFSGMRRMDTVATNYLQTEEEDDEDED